MPNDGIMPSIPTATISLRSPHRPTPKFFTEKTFSTKKERGNTPRASSYPRPPIKSCPPISRVFQHIHHVDKPRVVSLRSSNDSLSPTYDEDKKELYFQQCFVIEKKLGAGSFGDVYRVRNKEDGTLFAVKRSRERFKGELDRRRKLEEVTKHEMLPTHPNCVKFYKAWEEKQHLYIQTELCETSLANLTEKVHDIPEKLVWSYLIDLLRAVKHLHDYDLIHMDIKPDNIFITRDGMCKLGDFGLILDLSKNDITEAQEGDPKYLAPELMRGKFTKAADIFSLGITILELACDLDLPRGDEGWHQLRSGILPEAVTAGKLSPELKHVIQLMMEPDYLKRPSAEQILELPSVNHHVRMTKVKQIFKKQLLAFLWSPLNKQLSPSAPAESEEILEQSNSDVFHDDYTVASVLTSSSRSHDDSDNLSPVSVAHTLDFSTDSNDSIDFPLPTSAAPKAMTTGARRRPVRIARLLGGAESPVKTPSQGSPQLLSSSRSSHCSGLPPKGPSSTTPPSCKKNLFHDEDPKPPIGPKNLLEMFDNADSEEEEL